jgi:hypothetical protein
LGRVRLNQGTDQYDGLVGRESSRKGKIDTGSWEERFGVGGGRSKRVPQLHCIVCKAGIVEGTCLSVEPFNYAIVRCIV